MPFSSFNMTHSVSQEYWKVIGNGDINEIFNNKNVKEILKATLDERTALRLLKLITQAIVTNLKQGFKYDHNVLTTVRHLINCINVEMSNTVVAVLSCVYYISKCFIAMDKVEIALQLKPYFKSLQGDSSEEIFIIYYSFFYELHNFYKNMTELVNIDNDMMILYESLDVLLCCRIKYLHIALAEAVTFLTRPKMNENQSKCRELVARILKSVNGILKEYPVNKHCEITCKYYVQFVTNFTVHILENKLHLDNILNNVVIFETSDENCNKLISFFIITLKSITSSTLSLASIQEQTSILKHLIEENSTSQILFFVCCRFSSIYFSIQGYWLSTKKDPISCKEYLVTSELALCLSSFLRRNLEFEKIKLENTSLALLPFKVIISFIALGINFILECERPESNVNTSHKKVDDIFKQLYTVQTRCLELLVLREYDEAYWKDSWKLLAMRCTKLASVLEYMKLYDYACDVYTKVCCRFFEMEPLFISQNECVTAEEYIYKTLKGLSQCLIHQSKNEEALIYVAVAVLLFPADNKVFQRLWLSAKKNAILREDCVVQNLSVISVLKSEKLKLMFPSIFPKFLEKLDYSTICRLLVWELDSYRFERSVMYNPICAAGKELLNYNTNNLTFCEGIECVLCSLWVKYDTLKSQFLFMYDTGMKVLLKLETKIPGNEKYRIFSLIGNMHYYYYFGEVTALRKELLKDVNNMQERFPSKINAKIMKGFVDPSEAEIKSNIFTVYSDLNVKKEQEHMDILVKALDAWSYIPTLVEGANKEIHSYLNKWDLQDHIKTAACAFALYGYYIHSLKMWKLYYLVCKATGNTSESLYALSQVLKYSRGKENCGLWKKGNEIETELQNKDMDMNEKIVLYNYFLTKARNYLVDNECDVGWQYLQKVDETCIPSSLSAQLIFAQKHILVSKYLLRNCDFIIVPDDFENLNYCMSTIRALRILKSLYQIINTGTDTIGVTNYSIFDNCSLHLVMMEAAEWVGELWLGVKMYRDGYAHLKAHLNLAQILGLPSRCSQILCKLVQFDLLCHEVENGAVKLMGLEAILCLTNTPLPCNENKMQPVTEYVNLPDHLSLEDDESVKWLDVNVPKPDHNSPRLQKSPFKMPGYTVHQENCSCLFCSSVLLHNALMEVSFLKAQLHILNGDNNLAVSYFNGGVKLGKKLKLLQENMLNKLSDHIYGNNCNCHFSFSDNLFLNLSKLYLYYAEYLFSISRYEDMEQMMVCSKTCLLESQQCNLHFALEMIDKMEIMYSEINNSLFIDATDQSEVCETLEIEEYSKPLLPPCVMKTPLPSKNLKIKTPAVNRKESNFYLHKTLSPSLVVDLSSTLEFSEETSTKERTTYERKKRIPCTISFNNSLDDDDDNSVSQIAHERKTILVDSDQSLDEIDVTKCSNHSGKSVEMCSEILGRLVLSEKSIPKSKDIENTITISDSSPEEILKLSSKKKNSNPKSRMTSSKKNCDQEKKSSATGGNLKGRGRKPREAISSIDENIENNALPKTKTKGDKDDKVCKTVVSYSLTDETKTINGIQMYTREEKTVLNCFQENADCVSEMSVSKKNFRRKVTKEESKSSNESTVEINASPVVCRSTRKAKVERDVFGDESKTVPRLKTYSKPVRIKKNPFILD